MKSRMVVSCAVLIVLITSFGALMQFQARERGREFFKAFNSAEIETDIESVKVAYKGTEVKLVDGRVFVFFPITDKELNNGKKFNYTAEQGDRVIKKAQSDTLYLITKEGELKYTFQRFE